MSIKFNLINLENAKVELDVEISSDEVNKGFIQAFQVIASKTKIKGFRPGKAPIEIIKKHFKEKIKKEAFEGIINRTIEEIIKKEKIKAFTSPEIDKIFDVFNKFEEKNKLLFKIHFEIFPTSNISNYKELTIEFFEYFYTEEHINFQLKEMQSKMIKLELKEDKIIGFTDIIKIQYHFYLVSKDEKNNKLYSLNMRENDLLFESIKSKLIGIKKGESVELEIKIPHEYENKNMQGKNAFVYIKILEIQEQKVPKIDDQLAKNYNFNSLSDFKKDIREKLQKICDEKKDEEIFKLLLDNIINKSVFNIGNTLINYRVEQKIEFINNQLKQVKIPFNKYLEKYNQSIEELKANLMEESLKEIKSELVIDHILHKENIVINDLEINELIKIYAEKNKCNLVQIKNQLKNSKELDSIKRIKLNEKVQKFLISKNNMKNVGKKSIF